MGQISDLGRAFLRDYAIDGVPASGSYQPQKSIGREVFDLIDARLEVQGRQGLPFNNLVAFLGDSITAASIANTTTELRNSNRGPLTWLPTLTGGRFLSRQDLIFAVPGANTTAARAWVEDVIASGAGSCQVLIGTNDIPANDFDLTVGNLDYIYRTLTAANILVIALPILPRTLAASAHYGFANRVNAWIAKGGERYPNFRFIDPYLFGEPYSLTMSPRAGYTYDDLHPVAIGMRYIMKSVTDYLNTLRPPPPRRVRTVTDHYTAGVNPTGYANLNPMMGGTSGTLSADGANLTGVAPNNWNLFASAGGGAIGSLNIVGSKAISADGLDCARIEVSGSATGGFQTVIGLSQYNFPGGFTAGETIQLEVQVELEGGAVGVSGVGVFFQAAGNDKEYSWGGYPIVADDLTVDTYSGPILTEPMTLTQTPTLTSCGVWIFLKNVGTTRAIALKIVSIAVRRVIAEE